MKLASFIFISMISSSFAGAALPPVASCDLGSNRPYQVYLASQANSWFGGYLFYKDGTLNQKKSIVTIANAADRSKALLMVFEKKGIYAWSESSGWSAGPEIALPLIKKRLTDGAYICADGSTSMGMQQLSQMFEEGTR